MQISIAAVATLVALALLVGCSSSAAPVADVPTVASPARTATIAPAATITPTASPQSTATSTPIARPTPRTADTLPLDQPWLLIDGVGLCALSHDGALTLLNASVRSVIPRFGKPPVLVTGSYGSPTTLIEPLGWRRIPLPLEPGGNPNAWIASLDGQRVVAFVGQGDGDNAPQILSVDLQTGASSAFPIVPSEKEEQFSW
ncbi:MAG: hypothetical protein H7Y32_10675, partial [Chloroflexales bacterium]|nr:hypothetical protein [Chloroflexales bacterium]